MTTKHYAYPETSQGQTNLFNTHPEQKDYVDDERRERILERISTTPSLTYWTTDGVKIEWSFPHERPLEDAMEDFATWLYDNGIE